MPGDCKTLTRIISRLFPQLATLIRVLQKPHHRLRHHGCILQWNQQTVDFMFDDVQDPSGGSSDDRPTGRHALDDYPSERLRLRCAMDDDVGGGHDLWDI